VRHSPWPNPCDRSHGYKYFQRSRNSLTLRHALSFSENNHTHKWALIDRKGLSRGYLDYCSAAFNVRRLSCDEVLRSLMFVRDDSGVVRDVSPSEQSIYVIPTEQFIYVIPTAVEGSPAVGSEPLDLVGAARCRRQRKEILRLRSG
jgi:hypothetical protein